MILFVLMVKLQFRGEAFSGNKMSHIYLNDDICVSLVEII